MNKINSGAELRDAIARLEAKQEIEANILKEHLKVAYNSVKPINLIKSIFSEAAESEEIKSKIETSTAGLAAGIISKIIFQGTSKNPVKKLLGTALMFGVTSLVAKNPDSFKVIAQGVMNLFKRKKPKIPEGTD